MRSIRGSSGTGRFSKVQRGWCGRCEPRAANAQFHFTTSWVFPLCLSWLLLLLLLFLLLLFRLGEPTFGDLLFALRHYFVPAFSDLLSTRCVEGILWCEGNDRVEVECFSIWRSERVGRLAQIYSDTTSTLSSQAGYPLQRLSRRRLDASAPIEKPLDLTPTRWARKEFRNKHKRL